MSFAPLPLLPAHALRAGDALNDAKVNGTRGRRRPSSSSSGSKVWRVVTTDGKEGKAHSGSDDGVSTAIQRGNGVQIPVEKLLRAPSKPAKPSEWKASAPTGLTLEELRARAMKGEDQKLAHTSKEGARSSTQDRRPQVCFAPHVKIASAPPRTQAQAPIVAAARPEAEDVTHDLVSLTPSTPPGRVSNEPPQNARASCRPSSSSARLRHAASKLRPSTAPSQGLCGSSTPTASDSSTFTNAPAKRDGEQPKAVVAPAQQSSTCPSSPTITHCSASPHEPGFPDGYIVARLHPDGPFGSRASASKQAASASTPTASRSQPHDAAEPPTFRPARPQELPKAKGTFYDGTLILVREEARTGDEPPAGEQQQSGKEGGAASKASVASRMKQRVGKVLGDAVDAVAEAQQWPPPQRRVAAGGAAGGGRASTHVGVTSRTEPREEQDCRQQNRRRSKGSSRSTSSSKRKTRPPPSPPAIPARSSSAEEIRDAAAADPFVTTVTSNSNMSSTSTSSPARQQLKHDVAVPPADRVDGGSSSADLAILPIVLWSGWASCSSSASSTRSSSSSDSSLSSSSSAAPTKSPSAGPPESPRRRSAFDQSRAPHLVEAGTTRGISKAGLQTGQEGVAALQLHPHGSALLAEWGGLVRGAIKRASVSKRRPMTPAPAPVPAPLRPVPLLADREPELVREAKKEKEGSNEDEGRVALDLFSDRGAGKVVVREQEEEEEDGKRQHRRREVRIVAWPPPPPQSASADAGTDAKVGVVMMVNGTARSSGSGGGELKPILLLP